jgi:DNA polymerase-1
MYGATTGDSGRLVPRLRRIYPKAMGLVDEAARTGEDGGIVSTWLGRSSPPPSTGWSQLQSRATEAEASGADETRARRQARDRGRFTRNFVVQGTGAEWALCWIADLRNRLWRLRDTGPLTARPHLVFFLHDEVVVHTPADLAEAVAEQAREAAASAAGLLFRDLAVDFPLNVSVVRSYAEAGKPGSVRDTDAARPPTPTGP